MTHQADPGNPPIGALLLGYGDVADDVTDCRLTITSPIHGPSFLTANHCGVKLVACRRRENASSSLGVKA